MIKECRQLKSITQEQLAEKIGISTRQLQRIENNEESTKIQTLKKIIKALDICDEAIINFMKDNEIKERKK